MREPVGLNHVSRYTCLDQEQQDIQMFNTDKVGLAMSICIVLASDHICYHTYYAKTKFDLKVKGGFSSQSYPLPWIRP